MKQREFARYLRRHMTESENRLWRHLRAHRLDGQKFRRQQPIGPYVVDFVHFGARLIVEADGGQHNHAPHDERRDDWLCKQGFRVLRFWNHEIMGNLEGVLATILEAVTSPSPPAPLPQGERGDVGPARAVADTGTAHLAPCDERTMAANSKPLSPTKGTTNSKPLSPRGRGVGERGDSTPAPRFRQPPASFPSREVRGNAADAKPLSPAKGCATLKPLSPGGRGVGERGDK